MPEINGLLERVNGVPDRTLDGGNGVENGSPSLVDSVHYPLFEGFHLRRQVITGCVNLLAQLIGS